MGFDWGTAIAAYGAGLTTVGAVVGGVVKWRDRKPHVKVALTYGILAYVSQGKLALIIKLSNPGNRPVTIKSAGLELPDKRTFYMPYLPGTTNLPFELGPGQGQSFWMEPRVVAEELRDQHFPNMMKLRAFCLDAVGNQYNSKRIDFNVEARLKDE